MSDAHHDSLAAGLEHFKAGRFHDAEVLYRKVLDQDPDHADALHLLGVLALTIARPDVAVNLCGRAAEVDPTCAEFHKDLGNALRALGRVDEAILAQQRALAINPDYAEAHFNLGNIHQLQGNLREAIDSFRSAVKTDANVAETWANLGNALQASERLEEAEAAYARSLSLNPNLPRTHSNRGMLLLRRNQVDAAEKSCRRAVELADDFPDAHNNLGAVLMRQGRILEAITEFRHAVALRPTFARADTNLLLALHYDPSQTPESILEEHRRWSNQHARAVAGSGETLAFHNSRDPDRPLRIGYVSADFREHALARFLVPLLEAHDRTQFEIFCFADVDAPDEVTRQMQAHGDIWHFTAHLTDAELADLVRRCGIDILVDLALHGPGNRMLTFARKPAPEQITYLGYPSTTGIPTVDVRLTDARLDPPGNDLLYIERSIRLERYWHYRAHAQAPEIGPLPADQDGQVTFGCLSNPAKVSPGVLNLWREILGAVSGSKLLLFADSNAFRQRITAVLRGERVEFIDRQPIAEYLQTYNRIDIVLDTFPFNGAVTTFDALSMGVCVVTLAGRSAVQRMGASILSALELNDLIAGSESEYVRIASGLAADRGRLTRLRSTLRQRLLDQAPSDVERAYREAWRAWCAART